MYGGIWGLMGTISPIFKLEVASGLQSTARAPQTNAVATLIVDPKAGPAVWVARCATALRMHMLCFSGLRRGFTRIVRATRYLLIPCLHRGPLRWCTVARRPDVGGLEVGGRVALFEAYQWTPRCSVMAGLWAVV